MSTPLGASFEKSAGEILAGLAFISDKASEREKNATEWDDGYANPDWDSHLIRSETRRNHGYEIRVLQGLQRVPAIARVVYEDDETKERSAVYFCKGVSNGFIPNLASYNAPIGKIASYSVYDGFTRRHRNYTIVEKATFTPFKQTPSEGWDGLDAVLSSEDNEDGIGVASLLELIRQCRNIGSVSDKVENKKEISLEEFLNQEPETDNQLKRRRLTEVGLREQNILDKTQDEIFRLPISSRIMLTGPAGTGKTTTLIRRLAQKIQIPRLDATAEDEELIAEKDFIKKHFPNESDYEKSWLMFSPSELLKQYLRIAFNKEGVPAGEKNIRTWDEFRRVISRDSFHLLRSEKHKRGLILDSDWSPITGRAERNAIRWFEEFNDAQKGAFIDELFDAADSLATMKSPDVVAVGKRIQEAVVRNSSGDIAALIDDLLPMLDDIDKLVADLKSKADKITMQTLSEQYRKSNQFVQQLTDFLNELLKEQAENRLKQNLASETDDEDEEDDEDSDEVPEYAFKPLSRREAAAQYCKYLGIQARNKTLKKSIKKESRAGRILSWIGDRTFSDKEDQQKVGTYMVELSYLRKCMHPVRRYFDRLGKRYLSYRADAAKKQVWYKGEVDPKSRKIDSLELDLLILAYLQTASSLYGRNSVRQKLELKEFFDVRTYLDNCCGQVFVDEATDFSAVQLSCMSLLSHPDWRSFFACGDYNQRLTSWGTSSPDELSWIMPDLVCKPIRTAYRQSCQLHAFSQAILSAFNGEGAVQESNLPANGFEGVKPTLLEDAETLDMCVEWLASSIRYIDYYTNGEKPSIAVFVNKEEEVKPLAKALSQALSENNIPVSACLEGQALGTSSDVRVYDIKNIKGLEFEAAFYVDIDELAESLPDLFDKYLYVGVTRAAAFLGISCRGKLPEKMESMREYFVSDVWS